MALSTKATNAIAFAKWCKLYKVEPLLAAELFSAIRRSFNMGVKVANGDAKQPSLDMATDRVEELAGKLGFSVQWPGLWVNLYRTDADGRQEECLYITALHAVC